MQEESPNEPEKENNLMVRRALWSESNKEDRVRKSLFKTICRVSDKVWKVIIDSGSSKNLASEEMVAKL